MVTSNEYAFNLSLADVLLESFDRISVRGTSITREHLISGRRSLNLELQMWGNLGVNLWAVELLSIPLIQGIATYSLPSNVVTMLDTYLETYNFQTTVDITPAFSTVLNSNVVQVGQTAHGLLPNQWIQIVIPVSVGGLILFGLYQVTNVINANLYTVNAASNATATVNNGGAVPSFATTTASAVIATTLANHGYQVGYQFEVQVATTVGGLSLTGPYVVVSTPTADTFTFMAASAATANGTQSENTALAQLDTQLNSSDPTDRILTSISRTDYASQSDKFIQSPPTTFWFDRLSPIPNFTLWQVPDGNGPYAVKTYVMRRLQDASPTSGQTPDVPYLFIDALCAGVAARLARKYAADKVDAMKVEAREAWSLAATENRERVQTFIVPTIEAYFIGT